MREEDNEGKEEHQQGVRFGGVRMRTNKGKVRINKGQKWLQFFLSLLWYSLELLVHGEVSFYFPDLQVDFTNASPPHSLTHTREHYLLS